MERRVLVLCLAGLLLGSPAAGCGDDSGDGDGDGNGQAGQSGAGSNASGTGGGGPIGGEGVVCGTTRCQPQPGSTAEACCFDAFTSSCGMRSGFGGSACVQVVETDERCPSVMVGPVTLPSCCNDTNECGINAQLFGGGCIELSVAEEMARQRFANAQDAGFAFDGGTPMVDLNFPDPQACE